MDKERIVQIKEAARMIDAAKNYGVITHAGVYHSDDVVASNILKILGVIDSYSEIERVNSVDPGFEGLAFDIGGGRYDHHQKDCKVHKDGSKYSACTLIAEVLLDNLDYQVLYNKILRGIELTDNNGQQKFPNRYAHAVLGANQLGYKFEEVCQIMEPIIDSVINGNGKTEWNDQLQKIENDFKKLEIIEDRKVADLISVNKGKEVIILSEHLPAHKFKNSTLKLLIEKSLRGGYQLMVVSNKLKIPQEVNSWEGCKFVHTAGFIAVFDTIENAKKAAEKLLK